MPEKMWDPKNCPDCPLFPGACPYMGSGLRTFLISAVEKIGGEAGSRALHDQQAQRCEGDCEACILPDWMKNC